MARASESARRTTRTNLRFVAHRAAPALARPPEVAALARGRAKAPYTDAEITAYLALADAQPTEARRARLGGLLCLGLGAGLAGAELRAITGASVVERSGGLVVVVEGHRARVVPVLAPYQDRLVASAAFAGAGFVCGGISPTRKNVTSNLVAKITGGTDLARLDAGRLRATWLATHLGRLGLGALLAAAGITCSQAWAIWPPISRSSARRPSSPCWEPGPDGQPGRARSGGGRLGPGRGGRGPHARGGPAPPAPGAQPDAGRAVGPRRRSPGPAHPGAPRPGGPPRRRPGRLGVVAPRRGEPHRLTYRQAERTFNTLVATMDPTPVPSFAGVEEAGRGDHLATERAGVDVDARQRRLAAFCDAMVEASIPEAHRDDSTSVAVDWTDHASWSRPTGPEEVPADPDASWGHRNTNTPGTKDGLFFGYYAQAVTTVADDGGEGVPELIRRVSLDAPRVDPVPVMAATLVRLADQGVAIDDVVADSGYAHRRPEHWATPLAGIGARLVQDLHPADRGPKGTFAGAICCNGNLYCPATPEPLLHLGPLARGASAAEVAAHDAKAGEAARYKLGRLSGDDAERYHRVGCPAVAGRLRCPLRPASMVLGFERPEVVVPPTGELPRCCAQASVTVPPSVNAKTRQKHDYPSPAQRRSYARRSAAERSFASLKDPSSTDMRRGWCRLMGRTKNLLMYAFATVVRNLRILAAFERRRAEAARATSALKRRRRRAEVPPD